MKTFAIGVDYGTNSVRAIVVDTTNGKAVSEHVFNYRNGKAGIILDARDPNVARQDPKDYIDGFNQTVKQAVKAAGETKGFSPDKVVGIGVDSTGSTPIPVDASGRPLALDPAYRKDPAAHAWLWKDHTSHEEAAEITRIAKERGEPYLTRCGGTYSSEWFWAKIWHCLRTSPRVFDAAYSWVELCDFIPAYATGQLDPLRLSRSICAAGHKAMYADSWGGLPSKAFLRALSPKLSALRDRLYKTAQASDQVAGYLDKSVARRVGLPVGIPVAVGAFDAHHGAVGAGIRKGRLVKIIGTSTCDMLVTPSSRKLKDIPGICGLVPGSILPGSVGLEAGQSAVGDIFNWFTTHLCPPEYASGDRHKNLQKAGSRLRPGESGLLALDWNNGNRTVLVDPLLSGMLVGQTLHTTAPEVMRALVESTAFGALTIINRFEKYGVSVDEVVNCGGIAEKSPFLMQIYADICNRPMRVSRSPQTCALGAAIFGAVVGGAYASVEEAQQRMTGTKRKVYEPIPENVEVYKELYDLYLRLHDAFGTSRFKGRLDHVMKALISLRDRVRQG